MQKKVICKKPKWLRRICSFLLDFIIMITLALLISFASDPLTNKMLNGNEAREVYNAKAIETNLFYINVQNDPTPIIVDDQIDEKIIYFYQHCTDDKLEEYINKKKNSDLFKYDEESQSYVEKYDRYSNTNTRVKYELFYEEARDYCIANYVDEYLKDDLEYKKALNKMNLISYLNILICTTLSMLIVYLLIPMIHKEYKTIGKIAFKLKIASKTNVDLMPSRLQVLFRQLCLIFFELVLSVATIGMFGIPIPITLVLSILMVLFTKYNQSFHDWCCSTFLIDDYPQSQSINEGDKYEITFVNVEEVKNGK